jgi:hypothetical protein
MGFLLVLVVESPDNVSMFVREKTARGHTYLYLVENEREGGRIRQRIIRALGRKDVLLASGELDRLAGSLVRHCDRKTSAMPSRSHSCPNNSRPTMRVQAMRPASISDSITGRRGALHPVPQ